MFLYVIFNPDSRELVWLLSSNSAPRENFSSAKFRRFSTPVMPTTMFCDIDQNGFEEQRALQLAFELSMLGLSDSGLSGPAPTLAAPAPDDSPAISSLPSSFIVPDEARSKKSQNMTECVPVPSSEHVAEIVGRQGNFRFFQCSRNFPFPGSMFPAKTPALIHRSDNVVYLHAGRSFRFSELSNKSQILIK